MRALVNHIVHDLQLFAESTRGGRWRARDDDAIGADWVGAYRDAGRSLVAAWSEEGALEGTIELPFGTFPAAWRIGQHVSDLVVHGWDVAKATEQAADFDRELSEYSLQWAKENLRPEFRGRGFGPEVSAPEDAPLLDRLVAFFGRDPDWEPR